MHKSGDIFFMSIRYFKILLGLILYQSSAVGLIRMSSYLTPAAASISRMGSALALPLKYVSLYLGVVVMLALWPLSKQLIFIIDR